MHTEILKYENAMEATENRNGDIQVNVEIDDFEQAAEVDEEVDFEPQIDIPVPIRLQNDNNQPNVSRAHPYSISLRSKAEQDIVNDAKRKRVMLEMCDLTTAREEINRSEYSIGRLCGLRSLNLSSCNRLTDVSLKYAFDFLELRELRLSKCQQVTSMGLENVISKCPSLEYVDLSECHNINDKAIDLITSTSHRLTHLHIERCSQLTDHSLDSIATNCKRLKFLDVRGCRAMCSEPNLRLEHIRSLKRIIMSKPGPYMHRSGYSPLDIECELNVPKAPPMPPF